MLRLLVLLLAASLSLGACEVPDDSELDLAGQDDLQLPTIELEVGSKRALLTAPVLYRGPSPTVADIQGTARRVHFSVAAGEVVVAVLVIEDTPEFRAVKRAPSPRAMIALQDADGAVIGANVGQHLHPRLHSSATMMMIAPRVDSEFELLAATTYYLPMPDLLSTTLHLIRLNGHPSVNFSAVDSGGPFYESAYMVSDDVGLERLLRENILAEGDEGLLTEGASFYTSTFGGDEREAFAEAMLSVNAIREHLYQLIARNGNGNQYFVAEGIATITEAMGL